MFLRQIPTVNFPSRLVPMYAGHSGTFDIN